MSTFRKFLAGTMLVATLVFGTNITNAGVVVAGFGSDQKQEQEVCTTEGTLKRGGIIIPDFTGVVVAGAVGVVVAGFMGVVVAGMSEPTLDCGVVVAG